MTKAYGNGGEFGALCDPTSYAQYITGLNHHKTDIPVLMLTHGREYRIFFEKNGEKVSETFRGEDLFKTLDRLDCRNLKGSIFGPINRKVEAVA